MGPFTLLPFESFPWAVFQLILFLWKFDASGYASNHTLSLEWTFVEAVSRAGPSKGRVSTSSDSLDYVVSFP